MSPTTRADATAAPGRRRSLQSVRLGEARQMCERASLEFSHGPAQLNRFIHIFRQPAVGSFVPEPTAPAVRARYRPGMARRHFHSLAAPLHRGNLVSGQSDDRTCLDQNISPKLCLSAQEHPSAAPIFDQERFRAVLKRWYSAQDRSPRLPASVWAFPGGARLM